MFGRKKDELYEGQNDSKFDKFLKPLKKALFNIVYAIAKRFGMSTPEHYDLAIDEVIVSPYRKKYVRLYFWFTGSCVEYSGNNMPNIFVRVSMHIVCIIV